MNLFHITEKLGDFSSQSMVATQHLKPMDFFPTPSGFAASLPKEEVPVIAPDSIQEGQGSHAFSKPGKLPEQSQQPECFASSKLAMIDSSSSIGTSSSVVPPSLGNKMIHEHIQPPLQPFANGHSKSVIPIPNKQLTAAAPSKPVESKSWLGLAAQSPN